MAFFSSKKLSLTALVLGLLVCASNGQLSTTFYATSCPNLVSIVRSVLIPVIDADPRMGASLLRLFLHDCFVNGCDASVLLDDTETFTGEKNAAPNANSARGFDVIDTIKARVEAACPGVVSCADILALATREGVVLLRGPTWNLPFGRRDSTTANLTAANMQIPGPSSSLDLLIRMFASKGLTAAEMTILSGAHTIGQSGCANFRSHIYNDVNIDPAFATLRKANCPTTGGDRNMAPLDVQTVYVFDNAYYQNLVANRGLFHSDQELYNNGSQDALVQTYSTNGALFASDFAAAMVKLSGITPLTGTQGQIRMNCSVVNY